MWKRDRTMVEQTVETRRRAGEVARTRAHRKSETSRLRSMESLNWTLKPLPTMARRMSWLTGGSFGCVETGRGHGML